MATSRKLCYPHPKGTPHLYIAGGDPGGLHETGGLAHNWAFDYMAPGGTPIRCVEAGHVWKLSGRSPSEGVVDGDRFGWMTYIMTRDGVMYVYIHQGSRAVKLGDSCKLGQIIGRVGHWPHDEGRSHTHLGVTHPMGRAASIRASRNVAEARKI